MDASLTCSTCGVENRDTAVFCANCGHRLRRTCKQCGEAVVAGANFCDSCGYRLTDSLCANDAPVPPTSDPLVRSVERRQITVLICDLVGSTSMASTLDPEIYRHVLRAYQDVCVASVNRYRGHVSRFVGDAVQVLFGYPEAFGDDAIRAVMAARDIRRAVETLDVTAHAESLQLRVRIGVATGLVVAGDLIGEKELEQEAIVGDTPSLAARLQAAAGASQILLSPVTHRLLKGVVPTTPMGALRLKGFRQPVQVFALNADDDMNAALSQINAETRTPFLGRGQELARIQDTWSNLGLTGGRVMLVQGEPGIGKSRLVREFTGSLDADSRFLLDCRCTRVESASPLFPVVDVLRRVLDLRQDDDAVAILAKLRTALAPYAKLDVDADDLAEFLVAPQRLETIRPFGASRSQSRLPFDALISIVEAVAASTKVLLVLEDAHWSDASTRELLRILVERAPLMQLMLIVTARFEFSPEWASHSHVVRISLTNLLPGDSLSLVRGLSEGKSLSATRVRDIVERTDGVPLFIEELTRAVMDSREGDGVGTLAVESSPLIPETLRDSLMARLDQLRASKWVAQVAAVIGRSFTPETLCVLLGTDEETLASELDALVRADILYRRGVGSALSYQFKHSLLQDAAYDSLLVEKRREIHRHVAAHMSNDVAGTGARHPEIVAHHYANAEEHEKAARLWARASELCMQRAANIEALQHAERGLRQLSVLEECEARDRLELELQVSLGTSLSATEGYAIEGVDRAYRKALELSTKFEVKGEMFPVVRGLHSIELLSGHIGKATELARQLVEIGEASGDAIMLSEAIRCHGWTVFCGGRMLQGKTLLEDALARYDQRQAVVHRRRNVSDSGGVGLVNLGWVSWFTGQVDTALALSQQAIGLARAIEHPFTLAYALCMSAALRQCRQEPEEVAKLTSETMALSKEHGFKYWLAWAGTLHGWAETMGGNAEEGIAEIRRCADDYKETGAVLFLPYINAMLARCLQREGRNAEALDCVHAAQSDDRSGEVGFFSAELLRLEAEILSSGGQISEARDRFERAIVVAREQGASLLELRAICSSIRVDADSNRTFLVTRLRELLSQIESTGDNADLEHARELVA